MRLTMAGLEVEETAESETGPVLDIKVTPNRGDCLSVIGVARELAAAYRAAPKPAPQALSSKTVEGLASVAIDAPQDCPRYSARLIRNVKSIPSPPWVQRRLAASGMRPIGGIVDVTNYVMLEMGQPLHAFDYDTIPEGKIVVRRAAPGESLTTLDGISRNLSPHMLLICDKERPIALAGVMGGADAEIGDATKTVLLESAHFNPLSVRRTSKALGLRTEASYRFERYVDPEGVVAASDRACALITELAMGEPVTGVIDEYVKPHAERSIHLRAARASLLLGFEVKDDQIESSLTSLGLRVRVEDSGSFVVAVPSWRPDIVREEDVIEEVGRVVGYEHIPERLPHGASTQGRDSESGRFAERLRGIMIAAGLQEVLSHSLLAPTHFDDQRDDGERVGIRSALSAELSGLRRSLLPGLVDALERNARRGQSPLGFFEIGNVFLRGEASLREVPRLGFVLSGAPEGISWQRSRASGAADFYTGRGIIERVAESLKVTALQFQESHDSRLHPGRSADILLGSNPIGYAGELHPTLTSNLTPRERIIAGEIDVEALMSAAGLAEKFVPLSAYPAITRDLAPRVQAETTYAQVQAAVDAVDVPHIERMGLTDVFTGPPLPEGMKSLTLSFTFRSPERTLTDEEINAALSRIRSSLESRCGATFVA